LTAREKGGTEKRERLRGKEESFAMENWTLKTKNERNGES